ncbi:MAG: SUMF1/EgtB/PvdO family nonheme iron enzyme [Acidobacteria bacterium]|nr:SUMF1/EgtB/PvdO family nonheme iron enzyme [Acidobacteriota bacterium]
MSTRQAALLLASSALVVLAAAAAPEQADMVPIGDAGYSLDRCEVTNVQMAAFLSEEGNRRIKGVAWVELTSAHALIEEVAGGFRAKEGFADFPAVEVSFEGAKAFCSWSSKRLPSEREWLAACEGPEGLSYPWGHHFRTAGPEARLRANIFGAGDGFARLAPVGSFADGRSVYGIYDMSGNVWEWVASAEGKPFLRGGSWINGKTQAQCAKRADMSSSHSYIKGNSVGFRCAR